MLGSMLSIKPIISVVDGAVEEAGKVRTRSKALQFILDKIPEGNVESICVLHSAAADLDQFLEKVQPKVPGRRDDRRPHRARSSACTSAPARSGSPGSNATPDTRTVSPMKATKATTHSPPRPRAATGMRSKRCSAVTPAW